MPRPPAARPRRASRSGSRAAVAGDQRYRRPRPRVVPRPNVIHVAALRGADVTTGKEVAVGQDPDQMSTDFPLRGHIRTRRQVSGTAARWELEIPARPVDAVLGRVAPQDVAADGQ